MRTMMDGPEIRFLFPLSVQRGDEVYSDEEGAWVLVTDVRPMKVMLDISQVNVVQLLATIPVPDSELPRALVMERSISYEMLVRRYHW